MTTYTIGRWLLVALAVVGLAFAAPVVGAHGDTPTAADAPADDWMPGTMTHVVGGDHHDGGQYHGPDDGHYHDDQHGPDDDHYHDGRDGQGHGC